MRILFISRIPFRGVSGGRYLSALYAERLARYGHTVDFLVNHNNKLIFPKKIIKNISILPFLPLIIGRYSNLDKLLFFLCKFFLSIFKKNHYDHIVIIPEEGSLELHKFFYDIAGITGKKIHLLNFETPNWFNALSPSKRDYNQWDGWSYIASRCKSVISISKQSSQFAKTFFENDVNHEWLKFPVYQESDIKNIPWENRENSAICISRMDPHKGLEGLIDFLKKVKNLENFYLVLGSMKFDIKFEKALIEASKTTSTNLIIKKKISHEEKFELLGRCKYLVFPTFFEGLGMPPIEALASGAKVASFDLEVLKEISPFIELATPGNYQDLAEIVNNGINIEPKSDLISSVKEYDVNFINELNKSFY